MLGEGLVVCLEELEGFWDAGHGAGGGLDDLLEFLKGGEIVLNQSFEVPIDFLLELLILHTLG